MESHLVTTRIDQLENSLRRQGAAAKEDVRWRARIVQHLQDDLELLQVAEGSDTGEINVRAHSAKNVSQERALPVGAVHVDANDQRHLPDTKKSVSAYSLEPTSIRRSLAICSAR